MVLCYAIIDRADLQVIASIFTYKLHVWIKTQLDDFFLNMAVFCH